MAFNGTYGIYGKKNALVMRHLQDLFVWKITEESILESSPLHTAFVIRRLHNLQIWKATKEFIKGVEVSSVLPCFILVLLFDENGCFAFLIIVASIQCSKEDVWRCLSWVFAKFRKWNIWFDFGFFLRSCQCFSFLAFFEAIFLITQFDLFEERIIWALRSSLHQGSNVRVCA